MKLDPVLQRASSSDFAKFDPGAVIAAVNQFVPLGKEGALAVLDSFLAKKDLAKDPHRGIFLILRVLFDAELHPPMRLGASCPRAPASASALPRFPITIVEEVPLMLVASYTLRGLAEQVTKHVDHYRTHGTIRAAPLAPAPGPDRLATFVAQYHDAYGVPPSKRERAFVAAQLDRLQLPPRL